MKASEINLEKEGFTFNATTYPKGAHYKFLMTLGRVFPSTKPQAKFFVNNGVFLDMLNSKDVEVVESMLNKHGFEGEYKATKSGTWVRLINHEALYIALKNEFNF